MVKLTFCLRRLSHLSREEFQRYWLEAHGPLVRRHAAALRIAPYVQVLAADTPLNQGLAKLRGAAEPFDGVAELWFESLEDLQAAGRTPEGRAAGAALLEDEKRFVDHSRSPLWVGQERSIVG